MKLKKKPVRSHVRMCRRLLSSSVDSEHGAAQTSHNFVFGGLDTVVPDNNRPFSWQCPDIWSWLS